MSLNGYSKFYYRKFLTGDRQKDRDKLVRSNLIGLRISETEGQNFVMITEPPGTRIFIHGKGLFSKETAEEFFGGSPASFPYEKFDEGAKEFLRTVLPDRILGDSPQCERERILRDAIVSQNLTNPYAETFLTMEKAVAKKLVLSIHPRKVRFARNRSIPVLYSNKGDTMVFADLLHTDHAASGMYALPSPYKRDMIVITSPCLDNRFAETARHEYEHAFDTGGPCYGSNNYTQRIGMEAIKEKIASDFTNLQKIHAILADPEHYKQSFRSLCEKRGYTTETKTIMLDALKNDVDTLQQKARIFLSDRLSDEDGKLYPTLESRMHEIPAVIAELKGMFGFAFVKAALPNLYKSTRLEPFQVMNLRNVDDEIGRS